MENALQGIPGVLVHLDDILISGCNATENLKGLDEVLQKSSKTQVSN